MTKTPVRPVLDNPAKEPEPPKMEIAGDLGPVGEEKQEQNGLKDKDKIWRDPAPKPT